MASGSTNPAWGSAGKGYKTHKEDQAVLKPAWGLVGTVSPTAHIYFNVKMSQ